MASSSRKERGLEGIKETVSLLYFFIKNEVTKINTPRKKQEKDEQISKTEKEGEKEGGRQKGAPVRRSTRIQKHPTKEIQRKSKVKLVKGKKKKTTEKEKKVEEIEEEEDEEKEEAAEGEGNAEEVEDGNMQTIQACLPHIYTDFIDKFTPGMRVKKMESKY